MTKESNASDGRWNTYKLSDKCTHNKREAIQSTLKNHLICALHSNTRPASVYWPIISAKQISAATKEFHADLHSLNVPRVIKLEKLIVPTACDILARQSIG